jgi:hypothetical protein
MSEESAWEKIGVAAALSRNYAENQMGFLERLASWLQEIMPNETKIKRRGLFSTGAIQKITLTAREFQYSLDVESNNTILFSRAKVVKGIVLKTEEISPEAWLAELGEFLEKQAEGNRKARETLAKLIE